MVSDYEVLMNKQKLAKEALCRHSLLKNRDINYSQIVLLQQTNYMQNVGATIYIFQLMTEPYGVFRVENLEPYRHYDVSLLKNTKTEFIELNSED